MARTVRVLATKNVSIANGLEAGDTVDGVVLAAGDPVLAPYQTNQSENGVYIASAAGPASRASWADSADDLVWGLPVRVLSGNYGAGLVYVLQSHAPTLGVDPVVWQEPDPIRDGGRFYGGIDAITNANTGENQRWGWGQSGSVGFLSSDQRDGGMLPVRVLISAATANSSTQTRNSSWHLGGGLSIRWKGRASFSHVSDVVDNYTATFGLGDTSSTNMTDGVYFVHDTTTPNFIARTSAAGARTSSNTGIPNVANQVYDFEIRASSTSSQFFIDRVLVATIATNLPTASTNDFGLRWVMFRNSASLTADRVCRISYTHAILSWTPPRIAP